MQDVQLMGIIGVTGFTLVAGTIVALNYLSRSAPESGLPPDQATDLNRDVDEWLRRYRTGQG
jgi:hypothetical protein